MIGEYWRPDLFQALAEWAKEDSSGVFYTLIMDEVTERIESGDPLPDYITAFMVKELADDTPFRPIKAATGRPKDPQITARGLRFTVAALTVRDRYPEKSMYDDILPFIAGKTDYSLATVKKDYLKFRPLLTDELWHQLKIYGK